MRYTFNLRCIDCGGPTCHQADATVTPAATAALCRCTRCGLIHRIDLRLTPIRTGNRDATIPNPQPDTEYGRQLIQLIHDTEDSLR